MRRALLLLVVLVVVAVPAWAQNTATRTLSVGPTPAPPVGTTVRLDGLGTVGGTLVLLSDLDGDVFERVLGKADLPASLAYEDEANTFALLQTFTLGLTSNGTVTISGSNDLIVGTGGIRGPASNPLLIRNNTDSATLASFGNSGITLSQPTTIDANLIFTGSTRRIQGDFSNATLTNRVLFQTSTANTGTSVGAIPSGTGNTSNVTVSNRPDLDNAAYAFLAVNDTAGYVGVAATGTGSVLPFVVSQGGSERFRVETDGALEIASATPVRTDHYTSATTGWAITHAGAADFRFAYVDELHAKAFIADLEMALNGGQVIAKSTAILATAFTCPAAGATASLTVNDFPGFANIRVFAASDWVSLRSFSRTDADNDGNTDLTIGDCVGTVSAYTNNADVAGTATNQTWTFTRGSGGSAGAMTASTVVSADALVIDYGVSGQGFLVARSNDGAEGANSPYWQVVTWTTAPVSANMTVQTRWGNLNGSYGISTPTYGLAAGDPSDAHLLVTPTAIYLRDGTTDRIVLNGTTGTLQMFDEAGMRGVHLDSALGLVLGGPGVGRPFVQLNATALTFCGQLALSALCTLQLDGATGDITSTGSITIGSGGHIKGGTTAYATGTGFWLGNDSGTYKFYIGNGTGSTSHFLTWTGSTLSVSGAITALSDLLLGGSANIVKGAGSLSIGSTSVGLGLTLSAGGGSGTLTVNAGAVTIGGSAALSTTKTVRDSAGTGTCTLIFTLGSLTGGSC